MSASPRWVGVLGGMGPAATADFYEKLVQETPADRDQDHLPVVIWADPNVPDRSDNLLGCGVDPTPALRRGIRGLVLAGCDVLAVPCNTAHAYLPRLAHEAGLELVSIVDETASAVAADGVETIGLLATTGTVHSGLYADAMQRLGVTLVQPTDAEQAEVMGVIRAVKAGVAGPTEAAKLADISARLGSRGAERIVAACTELMLALGDFDVGIPVVDPARVLARQIVAVSSDNLAPVSVR